MLSITHYQRNANQNHNEAYHFLMITFNLLQYPCLENPMDRGVWQATVHGVVRVGHDLVTKPPPPPEINYIL